MENTKYLFNNCFENKTLIKIVLFIPIFILLAPFSLFYDFLEYGLDFCNKWILKP